MHKTLSVVIATVGLVALAGCASERRLASVAAPKVDRKLSTFAFIEEGKILTFIVDTRATRERETGAFIPFEVCVANRGLRNLSLSRESFTLVDEAGNRYPCVGPRELLAGYEFLDFDRRLAELTEITFNRFAAFQRYPSMFSPVRDVDSLKAGNPASAPFLSALVRDTLSLPKFGYMVDFVYFPMPKTGVKGHRFEMFLEAPELQDPAFVKFVVQ